jgi:hypothetical protein
MALTIAATIVAGLAAFVMWIRGNLGPAKVAALIAATSFVVLWLTSLSVIRDI